MPDAPPCNVGLELERHALQRPHAPALYAPQGRDSRGRPRHVQLSYAQLQAGVRRIAAGLEYYGLRRGMRAVMMVRPCLDFFALFFGMLRAGVVPVIVDPGIGRRNLATCLGEARPEAFIGEPIAHAARLVLGWARQSARIHITVGSRLRLGGITLEQVERAGDDRRDFEFPETRAEELAAILFTSGSTGISKGVLYEHGNFVEQVRILREAWGIEPGEIDLPTFAPFALFDAALGMTTVLPEMDFSRPGAADPKRIVDTIEQFGVTNLFGSPALIANVGRYGERRGLRLPSLRRAVSAGAPADSDDVASFSSLLTGDAQLHMPYGATEALPVTSIGSREFLHQTREATERGAGVCVGKPLPGVKVWVIAISDGPIGSFDQARVLADGEVGEIVVGGAAVTRDYEGRPEATTLAKLKHPDGQTLHRMGDLGRFDDQGRLWFCGRKSQRLVTADETLFTIPCERVFSCHPAVRRAALVAVRRAEQTLPVLCIEVTAEHRGIDPAALTRELLARGSQFAHTAKLHHILYHPAFPVDIRHNSKIFREKLGVWANKQLP